MLSRGTGGAPDERVVIEGKTSSQRGEDDVVGEVFGLVRHAAVSPRRFDEDPSYFSNGRHERDATGAPGVGQA